MTNLGGDRLQTVIYEVCGAFQGKSESKTLPAPSWKCASTERQQLLALHPGESQNNVAVIDYIHSFDCFCTLKGWGTLSGSSVIEISCYCSRGCRSNIPWLSPYNGSHVLVYWYWWSCATHRTKDGTRKFVDALLTPIIQLGQGGYRYLFFLYWWAIIPILLSATYHWSDLSGWHTNTHWGSGDAHIQNWVESLSLSVLPSWAASTSIMYNHDQISFSLPD